MGMELLKGQDCEKKRQKAHSLSIPAYELVVSEIFK